MSNACSSLGHKEQKSQLHKIHSLLGFVLETKVETTKVTDLLYRGQIFKLVQFQ